MCTCRIGTWGSESKSDTAIMHRCQLKILRVMADAPWQCPAYPTLRLQNDTGKGNHPGKRRQRPQ